jgi:hypothetical protein
LLARRTEGAFRGPSLVRTNSLVPHGRLRTPVCGIAFQCTDLCPELSEQSTPFFRVGRAKERSRRHQGIGGICSMRHWGTRNATLTRRVVPIGSLFDRREGGDSCKGRSRIAKEPRVRAAERENLGSRFGHELPTLRELEGGLGACASSFFVLIFRCGCVKRF